MALPALDASDRAMLEGRAGEACRLAMHLVVEMARVKEAPHLIDISRAHIDGGLYHGLAGLDFAERLSAAGARVTVPTTLNVGTLDLVHPHLYQGDACTASRARRLMAAYVAMGCEQTWTCAPYQLPVRPDPGEHVAWAESNAIVFANSVLGARTDRYGDFMDICAALTGRVPYSGFHHPDNRRGEILFSLSLPERLLHHEILGPLLGHVVGRTAGGLVPVIDGLPRDVSEDSLKALGAAAASSGSVGMFHVVGVTPEAATLEAALTGRDPTHVIEITPRTLLAARDELGGGRGEISAVSMGTPHFSIQEFERLVVLLGEGAFSSDVDVYVSTSRAVLTEIQRRGWLHSLENAGVTIVVDTCTYITPILRRRGTVMTNSAKWAYYAPGNIGVDVVFGSTEECIRSARRGRVWRDEELWANL